MDNLSVGRIWSQVRFYSGMLALVFGVFAVAAVLRNEVVPAIKLGVLFLLVLLLWRYARWLSFGFTVDAKGERQKVDFFHRGEPYFDPTTWALRKQEEAYYARERRLTIVLYGLGSFFFAAVAWFILNWPNGDWVFAGVAALLAITSAVPVLTELFKEALYWTGFQGMKGARVADPAPVHPGLKDVASQKAHGDARAMTEQEALDALKATR